MNADRVTCAYKRSEFIGSYTATVRRVAMMTLITLAAAGCGNPEPTPTNSPVPSALAAPDLCPQAEMRDPSGQPLDLSGQWRVNQNWDEVFIAQRGTCIYWMGRSVGSDTVPAGSDGAVVFFGRLGSDFVVVGSHADLPLAEGQELGWRDGVTFEVKFVELDGTRWPTLHETIVRTTGPEYTGWVFVPEETLGDRTEVVGVYGFDAPNCEWLDVDGQRYGLAQNPALVDRDPTGWRLAGGLVIGPQGESAHPGARLRVDARLAPGFFLPDCQTKVLLAWDLQLAP